jgi:hypothetical protein
MAIPPRLESEIQELGQTLTIDVSEDADYVLIVMKDFPLGDVFNMAVSDLLLKIPKTYPEAGPDMFWTHPDVKFKDERIPQAAEVIEDVMGRKWRRFSWHRQSWNPTIDNMHSHIEFIKARLRKNE